MEKSIRKKFWIFALPTMAAFTIGFIVPFVYGIFLSFCKFSTVTDWKWVGFKNYTRIFVVNGSVDTTFIHSIWYTALFTVVSVLIINIVSFAIAMALTKGIRGTNLFRTVFFLPNLIGGIVLSYVWLMIFNSILQNYSKTIVSSEWSAFWGLIAVVCWQQIGYMMIIYIAGIQNIPGELIEAAKIDGCSYYTIFTKIIFPLMVPTMITGCIFSFMWRWDDFLGALLYVNKTEKYPVSLALKMFCDPSSSSDYGAMFAMATLSILPAVLIFFCLQRYLVEGISTSGLKG